MVKSLYQTVRKLYQFQTENGKTMNIITVEVIPSYFTTTPASITVEQEIQIHVLSRYQMIRSRTTGRASLGICSIFCSPIQSFKK